MHLPTLTIAASGGRFCWHSLEVSWVNSIPEGCQISGPARWGYTTICWRSFGWYFGG